MLQNKIYQNYFKEIFKNFFVILFSFSVIAWVVKAVNYLDLIVENGYRLSGGEKQRLSIARALLKDTPILILDEPTASLDAETERRVMQNIAEWGKDRIIFIITHRLSTIKTADCIAVLESGVIEEVGTHSELLELNKGYSEFVRSEMGEL